MRCYKEFLKETLSQKIQAGEIASIRSFARFLGIDSSSLARVLCYQRELPLTSAYRIADKLELSSGLRDEFIKSVLEAKTAKGSRKRELSAIKYDNSLACEKHMPIIVNHRALSLLALFFTDLPKTIDTVQAKLGINQEEAELLLKRLYLARLIDFKDGAFFPTNDWYSTSDDKKSDVIRESHVKLLEIAKDRLRELPTDKVDYTSMKVPCSASKLPKVKREIRAFQNRIYKLLAEDVDKQDVFELAIQFFPQTKVG